MLQIDGRESVYLDENGRFHTARIARFNGLAIAAANGEVSDCHQG
jgi:hypothetical protein